MMTDRTAQILEAAIQEYINTGDPVSSGLLYDRYDFGIKPAMIRLELDELERRDIWSNRIIPPVACRRTPAMSFMPNGCWG